MTNFLLQAAQIFLAILTKTNLATFGQRLGGIGHIQLAKVGVSLYSWTSNTVILNNNMRVHCIELLYILTTDRAAVAVNP